MASDTNKRKRKSEEKDKVDVDELIDGKAKSHMMNMLTRIAIQNERMYTIVNTDIVPEHQEIGNYLSEIGVFFRPLE